MANTATVDWIKALKVCASIRHSLMDLEDRGADDPSPALRVEVSEGAHVCKAKGEGVRLYNTCLNTVQIMVTIHPLPPSPPSSASTGRWQSPAHLPPGTASTWQSAIDVITVLDL